LATGDHEMLGLTKEQAVSVLAKIIQSYADMNGADAVRHFKETEARTLYELLEKEGYKTHETPEAPKAEETTQAPVGSGESPSGEPADEESSPSIGEPEEVRESDRVPPGSTGDTELPPSDADGKPGRKLASFPQTLRERGYKAEDVTYDPQGHAETESRALELENKLGAIAAVQKALNDVEISAESMRVLIREVERKSRLLEHLEEIKKNDEADVVRAELSQFISDVSKRLINIGRAEEIVKTLEPLSAEATKAAATRLKQDATGDEDATLTDTESKALEEMAKENATLRKSLGEVERKLEKLRPVQDELTAARRAIQKLLTKLEAKRRSRKPGSKLFTRDEKTVEDKLAADFERSLNALKQSFASPSQSILKNLDRAVFTRVVEDSKGNRYFVPKADLDKVDAFKTPAEHTAYADELTRKGELATVQNITNSPLQSLSSPSASEIENLVNVGATVLFNGQKKSDTYGCKGF
jgi:hypothetical protein